MFCEFLLTFGVEGTRHLAVVCHIYSTPENGTLAFACFSLSFCSGQKKSPGGSFSLDSMGRGVLQVYIIFLLSADAKDSHEVSMMVILANVVVLDFVLRMFLKMGITTSTVFKDSGLSTWTDCSRIRVRAFFFFNGQEKILKMTARKKTAKSCPDFSFYKKQTGPTSTPNS